jgi:hypothetical protein
MQLQLGEMKQKLQEESTAQTMIQAQLQVESAARAEMEALHKAKHNTAQIMIQAQLQVESAARAEMEALHKAKELMQTFCP